MLNQWRLVMVFDAVGQRPLGLRSKRHFISSVDQLESIHFLSLFTGRVSCSTKIFDA